MPRPLAYVVAVRWQNVRRLPALVTNFDRKGLTHSELETLLHEFGHAMHGILSRTRYVDNSGTNVSNWILSKHPRRCSRNGRDARKACAGCARYVPTCPLMDDELLAPAGCRTPDRQRPAIWTSASVRQL